MTQRHLFNFFYLYGVSHVALGPILLVLVPFMPSFLGRFFLVVYGFMAIVVGWLITRQERATVRRRTPGARFHILYYEVFPEAIPSDQS